MDPPKGKRNIRKYPNTVAAAIMIAPSVRARTLFFCVIDVSSILKMYRNPFRYNAVRKRRHLFCCTNSYNPPYSQTVTSNILPTPALPGSGSRDPKWHYTSASQPDLCPAPLLFCCITVYLFILHFLILCKSYYLLFILNAFLFPH